MKISEAKIGQKVYYEEMWTGNIIHGIVKEIVCDTPAYCVLQEGYSTQRRAVEILYPSMESCKKAIEERTKFLVKKYKAEIKTLNDLLRFPLDYNVGPADEYTNYEAITAYKERANELGYPLD